MYCTEGVDDVNLNDFDPHNFDGYHNEFVRFHFVYHRLLHVCETTVILIYSLFIDLFCEIYLFQLTHTFSKPLLSKNSSILTAQLSPTTISSNRASSVISSSSTI